MRKKPVWGKCHFVCAKLLHASCYDVDWYVTKCREFSSFSSSSQFLVLKPSLDQWTISGLLCCIQMFSPQNRYWKWETENTCTSSLDCKYISMLWHTEWHGCIYLRFVLLEKLSHIHYWNGQRHPASPPGRGSKTHCGVEKGTALSFN